MKSFPFRALRAPGTTETRTSVGLVVARDRENLSRTLPTLKSEKTFRAMW